VDRFPLGFNTYCLRAFRWPDLKLLEYAASLKLDAVFLQDSLDPAVQDPAHWREVREAAQRLGLKLDVGGPAVLPRDLKNIEPSVATLRQEIRRAAGMGASVLRTRVSNDRAALPKGVPMDRIIETSIRVYKAVRTEAMDAGVKLSVENHKELLCGQTRQVIEGAGKEFVGSYLDTGNPVFVMEDPMETLETLGPLAVTFHLRDSVVYETKNGAAVQWVPLGEGVVDFKALVAKARTLCPNVTVHIKPITGRKPAVMAYLDEKWMQDWRDKSAPSIARFMALAKNGRPYDKEMVIEEIVGQTRPEPYMEALKFQQKEHMESSVEYGKKVLDLGIQWRS
jgi:sugar phosphate isomerase/epimerase